MINGIINIYKEKGYTSHDVVAKMRGILRIKKIGHTGTLDPDAEGVLPVCIGKATKVVDLIVEKDKTYEAILKLGIVTDTQDMTGEILRNSSVDVSLDQITEVVESFIGGYDQIPPMYSALKVEGKKLYELARQGKEIERKPRWVDIHNIQILEYDSLEYEVRLRIVCGKGTYIRTLLYDIGEILGCGGTMKTLIRSRVGGFEVKNSLRLSQVEQHVSQGTLGNYLIKVDDMFLSYPSVIVNEKYDKLIYNGNSFRLEHLDNIEEFNEDIVHNNDDEQNNELILYNDDILSSEIINTNVFVRVYDSKGVFIGIYRYDKIDKIFHTEKMFL
ncbi:MAG: tRNA pseudouridine(55) synthase TruB [Clostridiales bacterium]|nr:tRNA pseudouridine(55) synthase TruB [Clostridiales bacterium]